MDMPESDAEERYSPALWAERVSGGKWKPLPHLAYIGRRIASAAMVNGGGRLIVNLPPGMGKTTFLSKWCALWYLSENPEDKLIVGTNTTPLAKLIGQGVRDEADGNPLVGLTIKPGSEAKDEWETTENGGLKCVGVDKAVLGYRAHGVIIDDPYASWKAAWSFSVRRDLEVWFEAVMESRLEPGGWAVLLHHRMHPNDITDYLRKKGGWEIVSLPAIAQGNDPMGRQPGESIWPDKYPVPALERKRRAMRREIWEAMWQQNPAATGAGAVYHRFGDRNIGTPTLDESLPLDITFDFNRTPSMHVLIGQHDPKADEFRVFAELTESRTVPGSVSEVGEWVKANGGAARWKPHGVRVFGDPAGRTRGTQTGKADYELIRLGFAPIFPGVNVQTCVRASHPPIVDRVGAVNDALSDTADESHMRIHPACVRLLTDMREQPADDHGHPDEADPMLGHASAALGYWVHYLRPVGGHVAPRRGRFSVTV